LADIVVFSFTAATWSLVDGCRVFLLVDALPPRLHPPFVGNLCVDVFLWVGIVGSTVEVEVPPSLFVFSCCLFCYFCISLRVQDPIAKKIDDVDVGAFFYLLNKVNELLLMAKPR
jgi:hypothetical protein